MVHNINIFIHIIAGLIGIVLGIIAYASIKGGAAHRRYGHLFLWAMGVVVMTALIGVSLFRDRPFLTVVTLQAAYFSFSGFRVVKRKGLGGSVVDLLVAGGVTIVVILFFLRLQSANIYWNRSIVFYILFYLVLVLIFDLLRFAWPGLIDQSRFWLYEHIFKITGAFTALVSAGVGTVLSEWEPWNQIIPAIASTLWLPFCLWYFPRKMRARAQVQGEE
jgi:hypothetical protein